MEKPNQRHHGFEFAATLATVETRIASISACSSIIPSGGTAWCSDWGCQVLVPLPSALCTSLSAEASPVRGPEETGRSDGRVYYSWVAPVEWAVIQAPNPRRGSIFAPFTVPTAGHWSQARYAGCWISARGFMLFMCIADAQRSITGLWKRAQSLLEPMEMQQQRLSKSSGARGSSISNVRC